MTQNVKLFIAAVVIFLVTPMPIVHKYSTSDFDCGFDGSCLIEGPELGGAKIANTVKKTKVEVTTPLLAITVNEETLDFYSGTITQRYYVVTPVEALVVPLLVTTVAVYFLRKLYNKKLNKKASKKRTMTTWKQ